MKRKGIEKEKEKTGQKNEEKGVAGEVAGVIYRYRLLIKIWHHDEYELYRHTDI